MADPETTPQDVEASVPSEASLPVEPSSVEPSVAEVESQNRWAELENGFAVLQAERDALKKEVNDLRQQCMDQNIKELSARVDDERLKLQRQLEDAKKLAEDRWKEVEAKQAENARLSEELQKQTLALHASAQSKFQLEEERMRHATATVTEQRRLEELQRDKDSAEQRSAELEKALKEVKKEVEAQRKLLEENARGAQEKSKELEAARVEAELQKEDARQAREAEHREMQLKEASELQLQEIIDQFASERKSLEESIKEQTQKLDLEKENFDDMKVKLDASFVAKENLSSKLKEMEEQKQQLQKDLEELRFKAMEEKVIPVVPIVDSKTSELPMGHANLAELVYEATTSREEAVKERHLREQYQQALEKVEKEFHQHQPALISQRQEVLRLKSLTTKLTRQNEGLLERAEQLQCQNDDAEARAKKAHDQQKILEDHVREVAEQLTVLMHENRKLTGAIPENPSDLKGYEASKRSFRTIQELVDQNLSLRRSIAQMLGECEDEAQKELHMLRERNNQLETKLTEQEARHASHLQEIGDRVNQLEQDRDMEQKKRKALEAQADAAGGFGAQRSTGAGPQLTEEGQLRQAALRAAEDAQSQLQKVRQSATEAKRQLAEAQEQMVSERQSKEALQAELEGLKSEVEEKKEQLQKRDERVASLRLDKHREEIRAKELQAEVHQAKREKSSFEAELNGQKTKVLGWEVTCETFLQENSKLHEQIVQLQARMECESKAKEDMKKQLEEQHKESEALTKKQLELCEQRYKDLMSTAEERKATLEAQKVEAEEAKKRHLDLEAKAEKLEAKIAAMAKENLALKEHGGAFSRPRRGVEVQSFADHLAGKNAELQKQIAEVEEKLKEQKKGEEELKAQHVADTLKSNEEITKLEGEIRSLKEEEMVVKEKLKAHEELEVKVSDLGNEVNSLRGQLEKKDAELDAALRECTQKDHELTSKLDAAQRERAQESENEVKWEQKYHEQVQKHGADLTKLENLQKQQNEAEQEVQTLRRQRVLQDSKMRRSTEEIEIFKGRLAELTQKNKTLADENSEYKSQLLALPEAEALQRLSAELRGAKQKMEQQQVQLEQLETDKERLEEEAHGAHLKAKHLQEKLTTEQREILRLQRSSRVEQKAMAKLFQMDAMETELRRLNAENRSLQERLDTNREVQLHREAQKEWQAQKTELSEKIDKLQETLKSKETELTSEQTETRTLKGKVEEAEKATADQRTKLEEMTKENVKLQGQVKSKDGELQEQAKEVKNLTTVKELHMKKLEEKDNNIKTITAKTSELTVKITKLEESVKEKEAQVSKNQTNTDGLKAKAEEAQKTLADEQAKVQALTQEKSQIEAQLKTKDAELQKQVKETNQLTSLKQVYLKRVDEDEKLKTELKAQNKKLQEVLEKTKANAASSGAAQAEVTEEVKQLKGKLEESQRSMLAERNKIDVLEKENVKLQGQVKSKEGELQEQVKEVKNLTTVKELHLKKLEEKDNTIKNITAKTSELTVKITKLEESVKEKEAQVSKNPTNTDGSELQAKTEETQKTLADEQAKVQALTQEKSQMEAQLKNKDAELQKQVKETNQLASLKQLQMKRIDGDEKLMTELKAQNKKLQEELEKMKASTASSGEAQAEVTKVREELKQLKGKLEESQGKLEESEKLVVAERHKIELLEKEAEASSKTEIETMPLPSFEEVLPQEDVPQEEMQPEATQVAEAVNTSPPAEVHEIPPDEVYGKEIEMKAAETETTLDAAEEAVVEVAEEDATEEVPKTVHAPREAEVEVEAPIEAEVEAKETSNEKEAQVEAASEAASSNAGKRKVPIPLADLAKVMMANPAKKMRGDPEAPAAKKMPSAPPGPASKESKVVVDLEDE